MMAAVAKRGDFPVSEPWLSFAMVGRMAVDAAHAIRQMRRAIKVAVLRVELVAAQAAIDWSLLERRL